MQTIAKNGDFISLSWTLLYVNTKKARTQYRISPKANSVSRQTYIVFRMETKCFYYESKCKIKRRWMQNEKMHCFFASASSKCRRDCAIHEEFFDCSFCLTFDFAGITSLVPSFFFSRKLRERKTQPSKMQKPKLILGIFETQIHIWNKCNLLMTLVFNRCALHS